MEEKELIKDLKGGKEEAYYKLVNIYGNKLLRTCFLMLKDEKEAEDIVQDTFIKVFKYINGFKGNSSLYTWVYKIAQNIIKDKCKNDISTIPYEDYYTSEDNIEEIIINNNNKRILKEKLKEMGFIYKQVLVLFYFNDFSIKEISEILDEKEGTIKSKLSRGRKLLKTSLLEGGKLNEL
ncbi:RNA polymerase sigma factor [Clostridium cochlearium]|uniref:ECF subfamily RNA polymerase sigma-24 subunit n=1 Tax=Clostridium cochlearium TaxID=1494 RepID=A0A2X2W5Y1_CLOCO|nr:RNA polymerase sigma factor [Clostridium cochlearium]NOH15369.1 RNA polymerase sigma factor [Clostridium cochlearium]SQB36228.1 ECF subfamily RNA polymerase sigma-24 subunit [Clostridium cochlearium]